MAGPRAGSGVVVAGLGADIRLPGAYTTLVSGRVPVLVVRGEDGALHATANPCRHDDPLVVAERAGPGMRSTDAFTCLFADWPGPHDATRGLRPRAVAEAYGIVLVRPAGTERIDTRTVIDAGIAPRLADLGVEDAEWVDTEREIVAADWRTVAERFTARTGAIVVAEHAVLEPAGSRIELTRVFALAESGDCVVDRRRYRLRA